MIDRLPLELFGDESATDEALEQAAEPARCPWCAASVAAEDPSCAACGARIVPVDAPAVTAHAGICQWCGAAIPGEVDRCPACDWDARGDDDAAIPGITTPLSEAEIRSLYGSDDDDDVVPGDVASAVIQIVGTILVE